MVSGLLKNHSHNNEDCLGHVDFDCSYHLITLAMELPVCDWKGECFLSAEQVLL